MRKRLIAVGAALGIIGATFLGSPALAASDGTTGSLKKNTVVRYSTVRKITVAGSNIYVKKTDGPKMEIRWYRATNNKCGDDSVHGDYVTLPNEDPTGRIKIGSGFKSGTAFCLEAISRGNNSTDTWSGYVDWNVKS